MFHALRPNRLLVLLVAASGMVSAPVEGADNRLDLLLQPWSNLSQNDSWHGLGAYEIGFHRIKSTLLATQDAGWFSATGVVSVNLAEAELSTALQNAWVSLTAKPYPYLRIKAGKFKIPFGANNLISDVRLLTIHRSFTTAHLQNALMVAGYRSGVMAFGSLNHCVDYALGTFEYPPNALPGTGISDLYRLPVGRLCVHPHELIDLEYMIAAPQMARISWRGETLSKRLFLHDAAIHGRYADWYQGFFEVFFGVDTSNVEELSEIWLPYTDNIAYSLYMCHSFAFWLPLKMRLRLTTAGEFINGLNYAYAQYVDRPFYYAAMQCVRLEVLPELSLEVSYDTRIGKDHNPFRFQRLSAQINYQSGMKLKQSRAKRGEKSPSE